MTSSIVTRAMRAFGLVALAATAFSQPLFAIGIPTPQKGDKIEASAVPQQPAADPSDSQFHALFMTWKKADAVATPGAISVPSSKPVATATYTSGYGVRSDPFRGTAAMHAGVDIPGALGTPIYATADGIISKSGRTGGYGNLVEINHGRGIATRYGHLSKIMVADGTRVKRGQIIGLMGSTGRSTGSHLHYEVRVDGKAVNPIPFLQTGEYLVAVQDRAKGTAVGGPAQPAN